jgi:signal transduction histidine kinase
MANSEGLPGRYPTGVPVGLGARAVELVSSLDPREIILGLVRLAAEEGAADRCTLTSVDQDVMRVEASFESGKGSPAWVGREYPLAMVSEQPSLEEAIRTGKVVTGGGFGGATDPDLSSYLSQIRHTAVVPLPLGDAVGAVLILSRRQDREFAAAELEELQSIGVLAILALRNARLLQDVHDAQARGLNALTLVSEHLAASGGITTFFGRMSRSAAELTGAERAAFWLLQGEELVAQSPAHGFDEATLARMRVPVAADSRSPLPQLLFDGRALGGRITEAALAGQYGTVLKDMGIRDVIAVPWRTAARTLGMLAIFDSNGGFGQQDEWVLRLVARASALVWQAAEAEKKAEELQQEEKRRLQEHAQRMGDLDQQKSEFLRLASHELRAPIGIVRGYLSMMEDGSFGEMPPAALAAIPTMTSRLAQMNLMVQQLLNAARLEDSKLVNQPRQLRLDQLVTSVANALEGLKTPGHLLVLEGTDAPVSAYADHEKVETIVGNLLSNAFKYSPKGGKVTVSVSSDGSLARVQVRDEGIGIDEADIPLLFARFTRIENAATAGIEGTGLGLYLSRELARLQGGDLVVQSSAGPGTLFVLTLPSQSPAGAARA